MMGWIFIILGLVFIGIVIVLYLKSVQKSNLTPEERPENQQNLAQPGQNFVQGAFTSAQLKRDTKLQTLANESSGAATEGIRQTTEAIGAKLEKEALPERHEQILEKEKAEHETYLTQHNVIQTLANKALDKDRTVEVDQQLLLEQGQSDIRTSEHEKKEKTNLDNKLEEIRERVRLAIIAKFLSNEQIVTEIQTQIDNVYIQIDETKTNTKLSEESKTRMIADREEIITSFKAKRNERQAGLLEANNRGNLRGDDLDAEL